MAEVNTSILTKTDFIDGECVRHRKMGRIARRVHSDQSPAEQYLRVWYVDPHGQRRNTHWNVRFVEKNPA